MPKCKTCRKAKTEAQAAASLFDLSFFRVGGVRIARRDTKIRAAKVGPLCPTCLERRKDLAE